MQNDFYSAGYNDALVKMGGLWGQVAKGIGAAGKWVGGLGAKMGPVAPAGMGKAAPTGWLAGKAQGAAQGLGNSMSNLAAAPGQTMLQGAGNFAKNTIGLGKANTTSGVLGRGAMGYGLVRGATGGFGAGPQPQPGQLPGPGQFR